MPIIISPPLGAVPPTLKKVTYGLGKRNSILFGGQAVPIGNRFGPLLPYVDLNDGVSFRATGLHLPDAHTLQMARLNYRGKAIKLADDVEPVVIGLPFEFDEVVHTLSSRRGLMMLAGKQWLTFDGGITGIECDCKSLGKTTLIRNGIGADNANATVAWSGEAEFLAREPFFRTIFPVQTANSNVPASAGGTATQLNVSYGGEWWAEPHYTFAMPVVGGSPLVTFLLFNATGNVSLSFALPADGNTYVVDCELLQVYRKDNPTVQILHQGSFPMMYATPGVSTTVNQLVITATCTSSCTPVLHLDYQSRYTT